MHVWPVGLTGPFTRAQGLRAGLTDADFRGPACVRVFQNVYALSTLTLTTEVRARAALAIAPDGAVVSRHTAAAIWGGVTPAVRATHLTLPPGGRMRVEGIDARARRTVEVVRRGQLVVTSPGQTFVDLGPDLDLVELVVLGDSLVGATSTTPEQLVARAAADKARASRKLRRAAAYVRTGVESPMETRLRMLLVLAGLPEPVVQHPLRDETGRIRYRLDLAYPRWRIAIEYDGRQHAENTAQWRWDVRRREDLDADGWRLVVVLSGDLYRTPSHTLDRVLAAARSQGVVLHTRSEEWRRHFAPRE